MLASGMPAARPARETICWLCSSHTTSHLGSQAVPCWKQNQNCFWASCAVPTVQWAPSTPPSWLWQLPGPVQDPWAGWLWAARSQGALGDLQATSRGRAPAEQRGQGQWPPICLGVYSSHAEFGAVAEQRQELSIPCFSPATLSVQSVCACVRPGGIFKDRLQLRNHKCGGQSLSASLLTQDLRGGKSN